MARCRRLSAGGLCFHAINRGNRKHKVFHDDLDYRQFTNLIAAACERIRMRILAWCLMPNHFHFVLWPLDEGDMSRWMHWLLSTHVRRHHRRYGTSGHIWQGRFKAFPIQQDEHLLTVQRYVERNPLRAKLVSRAEEWRWSSLHSWVTGSVPLLLDEGPVSRWSGWLEYVNAPHTPGELQAVRRCLNSEAPYGDQAWTVGTAERLGLVWTLRGRGRPARHGRPHEKPASR